MVRKIYAHATVTEGVYWIREGMGKGFPTYFHKNDYCLDEVDALRKARSMREKKIASLEKQIAKLNGTTFSEAK